MIFTLLLSLLTLALNQMCSTHGSLEAECILKTDDNKEVGIMTFSQSGCHLPLTIHGNFYGLPANQTHMLHIHQFSIADSCANAGEIFNPSNTSMPAGGFPEFMSDMNGNASFNITNRLLSLRDRANILGRSCMVHIPTVDEIGNLTHVLACGNVGVLSEKGAVRPASPLHVARPLAAHATPLYRGRQRVNVRTVRTVGPNGVVTIHRYTTTTRIVPIVRTKPVVARTTLHHVASNYTGSTIHR
jgi:Cu/Zn superoxide dismutase